MKRLNMGIILLSFAGFFAVWALRVALLSPVIDGNFGLWGRAAVSGAVKTAIWLGFFLWMTGRYASGLYLSRREMFANRVDWKLLAALLGTVTAYHLIAMVIMHGGLYLNPDFHPGRLIGTFLLVGILEEPVFRGWFYNSMRERMPAIFANLISSLMFTVIHFPKWIYDCMDFAPILSGSIGVFALSVVFGWSFERGKSIWIPVIIHMVWDLLSITLI